MNECVVSGSGAWWRRRRPAADTGVDQPPRLMVNQADVTAINTSSSGHVTIQSRATLALPSAMPRSAGSSPGTTVTKPAGASPLVPSCRSAFSATGRGSSGGLGFTPTSPYSDSAASDHPARVTSVKQMAQLFEDASSWQRDVRRQQHHPLFGIEVSRQLTAAAAERPNFAAVNSQLFFFPSSSTTSISSSSATTTTMKSDRTTMIAAGDYNATVGQLHPTSQRRKTHDAHYFYSPETGSKSKNELLHGKKAKLTRVPIHKEY